MNQLIKLIWVMLFLLLSACGSSDGLSGTGSGALGGDDGGISGTGTGGALQVEGFAQKGPFLEGAQVRVQTLVVANQESQVRNIQTGSGLGDFRVELNQVDGLRIDVTGRTFNEITGGRTGPISLSGVYNVRGMERAQLFVNVLTHLTHDRILFRLNNEPGTTAATVIPEVETELKREISEAFGIDESLSPTRSFGNLSLYNLDGTENDNNAYLLFVSATLYQHVVDISGLQNRPVDTVLQEVLSALNVDFREDGTWDDEALNTRLGQARLRLNINQVRTNLETFSQEVTGSVVAVPSLERYVNRLFILNPAADAAVSDIQEIRLFTPSGVGQQQYRLLVDGEEVDRQMSDNYRYNWNPYFWSRSERHSLIVVVGQDNDVTISTAPVAVSISPDIQNLLRLSSPANEAVFNDQVAIALSWEALLDATEYCVQIAQDKAFSSPAEHCLSGTTYTTVAADVRLGKNYWRLSARNRLGEQGVWSAAREFTITPPVLPVLNDPVVVAAGDKFNVTVSWQSQPGVNMYQLALTGVSNTSISLVGSTTENSFVFQELEAGSYDWTLRRVSGSGFSSELSEAQRLDPGGLVRRFGGSGSEEVRLVRTTRDGGVLFLGSTMSSEKLQGVDGSGRDWLVKLDANGDLEWEFVFADGHATGPSAPIFLDFHEFDDERVLIVGRDRVSNHADLVLLGADGQPVWQTDYRGPAHDIYYFQSILVFNDKVHVVAGGAVFEGGPFGRVVGGGLEDDFLLHEVDIQQQTIKDGISFPDYSQATKRDLFSARMTPQGKIVAVGVATSEMSPVFSGPATSDTVLYAMGINTDLTVEWEVEQIAQQNVTAIRDFEMLASGDLVFQAQVAFVPFNVITLNISDRTSSRLVVPHSGSDAIIGVDGNEVLVVTSSATDINVPFLLRLGATANLLAQPELLSEVKPAALFAMPVPFVKAQGGDVFTLGAETVTGGGSDAILRRVVEK